MVNVASGYSPARRANASSVLSMHLRALSVPTEITARGMLSVFCGTSDRSTPLGTTRESFSPPRYGATRLISRVETAMSASASRAMRTLRGQGVWPGMK